MISGSLRWPIIGLVTVILAGPAASQESLDRGKTPAQLFASDCSPCHKSPQGLAKSGGLFGLDGFLREHYTASRESAAVIANYLKSMEGGPSGPGRATKRATKGEARPEAKKKPAAKSGEGKGAEKKPDTASEELRPPGILAPEPKTSDTKINSPAAGGAKPAEGRKKPE
ncbi:MAG TPA: hypothetical protein VFL53_17780 [Pseudolabrys sp.]|nr:hypothetical protein [Pseudolabrys sp.]